MEVNTIVPHGRISTRSAKAVKARCFWMIGSVELAYSEDDDFGVNDMLRPSNDFPVALVFSKFHYHNFRVQAKMRQ